MKYIMNKYQIFLKPIPKSQKYFVFNEKKFLIDFELLKNNSFFFFRNQNQYENVECINLFQSTEIESFKGISDKAIKDFISLCQNEACQISNSDLYDIQYLARKFEVTELTKLITNIISNKYKELAFDSFLFQNTQNDSLHNTFSVFSEEYTEVISNNLIEFIKDDRLLRFPISILYQIINKYRNKYYKIHEKEFKSSIKNKNYLNDWQQIIEFLFKYLDSYGREASILFSLIDFQNDCSKIINRILDNYLNDFDFDMISNLILKFSLEAERKNSKLKIKHSYFTLEMANSFEIPENKNIKFENGAGDSNNHEINIIQVETNFRNENSLSIFNFSDIIIIEN